MWQAICFVWHFSYSASSHHPTARLQQRQDVFLMSIYPLHTQAEVSTWESIRQLWMIVNESVDAFIHCRPPYSASNDNAIPTKRQINLLLPTISCCRYWSRFERPDCHRLNTTITSAAIESPEPVKLYWSTCLHFEIRNVSLKRSLWVIKCAMTYRARNEGPNISGNQFSGFFYE